MPADVSSNFVEYFQSKSLSPSRKFYIGDSDYTSRVLKYPSTKVQWDNPKPITANIELANEDGGMLFLRIDKTLLNSTCIVNLIAPNSPDWLLFEFRDLTYAGSPITISNPTALCFSPDGIYSYVFDNSLNRIRQYYCSTPFNFTSGSYTALYYDTNAALGITSVRGLAMSNNKQKLLLNNVNEIVGFDLSSDYTIQSMSAVTSHGWGAFNPSGISIDPSGTHLYASNYSAYEVHKFILAGDCDVSAVTSHSYLTNSYASVVPYGLDVTSAQDKIFTIDYQGHVHQFNVSSDISSYYVESLSIDLDAYASPIAYQLCIDRLNGFYINVADGNNNKVNTFESELINNEEAYTLYSGNIDQVNYSKGKCVVKLIDKMQQLSDRLIGNDDTPVYYTNTLISSLAWHIVTNKGGFSSIASDLNPDINYTKFSAWAAVMSGDNVLASAEFKGIKVTEALRKIAKMTRSAIYIEDNKLVFNRFSEAQAPTITINDTNLIEPQLSIKYSDIINKQYVHAAYDSDSDYHAITVYDVLTPSVNSFGLHEEIHEDTNIWFVDSTSALTLAQRITFTDGEPVDRINVTVPFNLIATQIGETVAYLNDQVSIDENFKIMDRSLDIDKSTLNLTIDRSQLVNPFILDVTSLDGTEVLT